MLKRKADLPEEGITASHDEIAADAIMAQNSILSYGGVTPCMAVLGTDLSEFYEIDSTSVEAGIVPRDGLVGVVYAPTAISEGRHTERRGRNENRSGQRHATYDGRPGDEGRYEH